MHMPASDVTDTFHPARLPADRWESVREFVADVVREAAPLATPRTTLRYMHITSRFVDWAVNDAQLPMDVHKLFDYRLINLFVQTELNDVAPATRGTYRTTLVELARRHDVYVPEGGLASWPRSNPSRPYTGREVTTLVNWAANQDSSYRRHNASVLLSAGLGAGVKNVELAWLTVGDVLVEPNHSSVLRITAGECPRLVSVLPEWTQPLEMLVRKHEAHEYAFRPGGQARDNKNLIDLFVERTATKVRPTLRRMRATWLVTHLSARTPIDELVRIAGVQDMKALFRFLPFVPGVTNLDDARNDLRTNGVLR